MSQFQEQEAFTATMAEDSSDAFLNHFAMTKKAMIQFLNVGHVINKLLKTAMMLSTGQLGPY